MRHRPGRSRSLRLSRTRCRVPQKARSGWLDGVTDTTPTQDDSPEIVTEGTGWFEEAGDQAELDVTFTATGKTRSAAVRELGIRLRALDVPVIGAQVIRHRRLRVHNEWKGNRVVGCRAAEDVALLVPDVAALEEVLGVLVGAEPTDLNGPRWILRDPAAAQREAQRRAVDDARVRAEGYATALGGRLGRLRRLSEAPDHGGAPVAYRMAAREAVAPDIRDLGLEPELVRVTARCTTSWVLLT
jgi:uncharacterized protein